MKYLTNISLIVYYHLIEDKIKAAETVEEQLELMEHYRNVQKVANMIDFGKLGRTII
jgi:hypothetical protein